MIDTKEVTQILRDIVSDGFLSDTNMHRARTLLHQVDQGANADLRAFLEECRANVRAGLPAPEEVKRYKEAANCGLREAYNAVVRGA